MGVVVEKDQQSCDNSNQDGAVYKGDVEDLCSESGERTKENLLEEDFSLVEVPSQGTDSLNFSLEQVHPHQQQLDPHQQHQQHQQPYPSSPKGGRNRW